MISSCAALANMAFARITFNDAINGAILMTGYDASSCAFTTLPLSVVLAILSA